MKISFDLTSTASCIEAISIIGHLHPNLLDTVAIAAKPDAPSTSTPDVQQPPAEQARTMAVDPVAGVPLDANGTPWIQGVHATTKSKTKNGVWKTLRGADKDMVIKAEMDARAALTATPDAVIPEEPVVPVADQSVPVVTMEDVAAVWTEAVQGGFVTPDGAMALYQQLDINPQEFVTNETSRATLVGHLNRLMNPVVPGSVIPGVTG